MKNVPTFSVIVPWSNRSELTKTLADNEGWIRSLAAEVLIINCGGSTVDLLTCMKGCTLDTLRCFDLHTPTFNKCLALNLGAWISNAPILFSLDADVIASSETVLHMLHSLNSESFVTIEWLMESQPKPNWVLANTSSASPSDLVQVVEHEAFITLRLQDKSDIRIRTFRQNARDGSRAGIGQMMLYKHHLVEVDGYNSDLNQWGWEDIDIVLRLKRQLNLRHVEIGEVVHLSHDDHSRAIGNMSRARTNRRNFERSFARYLNGDFSGTYLSDINTWHGSISELERP